ncbi:DnaJ-domain-containing protein [Daedalea quercina L-15889]|uniref:DnaJ-domain-containing protein n=1 Tax=Daedalea quercina L-15889 TaxID=1314783 RepID=A0A165MFG7_9APHY|nr:DnaJ-domain-containing protein [Daedalea quercina L-15889]
MATSRSLYDTLGIPQSASTDAVRKAYKLQALQTHPDKLPLGTPEAEIEAAKARFRDVRTAFEVLSDPAKRRAYDNGLEYLRRNVKVNVSEMQTKLAQAKLARERAEWARQAELRHQERMRVLREEVLASQRRYQETMAKAELRYQERVRAMEEELTANREAERREEASMRNESYDMAEDMLQELRKLNPEWEVRRKEVLRRQAERMKTGRPPMRPSQSEPVYF